MALRGTVSTGSEKRNRSVNRVESLRKRDPNQRIKLEEGSYGSCIALLSSELRTTLGPSKTCLTNATAMT